MTNNDILRRTRYTFDFNDNKVIKLFALGGLEVTRAEISAWLKKKEHPDYKSLSDKRFATFLNGFIVDKRGKREGKQAEPEETLNNNLILRKLKIALTLDAEDILEMLLLADMRISQHELSAFFRKPTQRQYRPCKDQILRNFLQGMQIKYRKYGS